MSTINLVIGTAGHIDHGKTTLLKALTGIDADRLKEEKERGITIDIGFAPWCDPPYCIGFVDVPGHERFIKNMLAGAGGIDGVLLVVAADEGVKPQTREHFDICRILGLQRGLVAITKVDLVEADLVAVVEEEIRVLVKDSFLANAPIVRTSAGTGEGIDRLKQGLRQMAEGMRGRPIDGVPRLFIDRVFTVKGFGTVITGTVQSGCFRVNETVVVYPSGKEAKIRHIQVYGQDASEALAGQRAAFNLAVAAGGYCRGMVVTLPGVFTPSAMFGARFQLLPSFSKNLGRLAPVHIYHGAAELEGRIQLIGRDTLEPGESCFIQVRLAAPVLVWPGDHFIARQYSPLRTMGGGIVVLNHAVRYRKKDEPTAVAEFESFARADHYDRIALLLEKSDHGLSAGQLMNETGLSLGVIEEVLTRLHSTALAGPVGGNTVRWLAEKNATRIEERFRNIIHRHLARNPLEPGIRKQALRSLLGDIPNEVFGLISQRLQDRGELMVEEDWIRPPGRKGQLDDEMRVARATIGEVLQRAGIEGLNREQLLAALPQEKGHDPAVLDFLLQNQSVVRVGEDYYLHPEVLAELVTNLRRRVQKGEPVEVGEFKEWFGLTRKRAIPLLEYLDRREITFRSGSGRRLR